MKYRNEHYREGVPPGGKTYTQFSDVYEWDDDKQEPVVVGQRDDQQLIQSNEGVAFKKILEKFLPPELADRMGFQPVFTDEVVDVPTPQDDLDYIRDLTNDVDDLYVRYGISPDVPIDQMLSKVMAIAEKECKDYVKSGKSGSNVAGEQPDGSNVSNIGGSDVDSNVKEPVEQVVSDEGGKQQ